MANKKGFKVIKNQVEKYLKEGKRLDGRSNFEFRDIKTNTTVSINAEGSVSVKIGETEVLAGIKMGVGTPYSGHEHEGTMMTSLELTPLSSPDFDYGPPRIESIEPARIIDRGIRESGFIDFEGLCIKKGEAVWNVFVDIITINNDGNLIDAGALAAVIALRIAKMPAYDEETGTIKYGEFTENGLPLVVDKMPITMTFYKAKDSIFVDPTLRENKAANGRLTIEVSQPKDSKELMINAMQKGDLATLTVEEVEIMLNEAKTIYKTLNDVVEEAVKNA